MCEVLKQREPCLKNAGTTKLPTGTEVPTRETGHRNLEGTGNTGCETMSNRSENTRSQKQRKTLFIPGKKPSAAFSSKICSWQHATRRRDQKFLLTVQGGQCDYGNGKEHWQSTKNMNSRETFHLFLFSFVINLFIEIFSCPEISSILLSLGHCNAIIGSRMVSNNLRCHVHENMHLFLESGHRPSSFPGFAGVVEREDWLPSHPFGFWQTPLGN